MRRKEDSALKTDVVWKWAGFTIAFAAAVELIFWKCRFGLGDEDEAFYLTIPYRLCLGDALFSEEWNLSQMTGFLLYPFVRIYLAINQSMDGIILTSRYLYATIQCGVGLLIFCCLKKINWMGAAVASICFVLYAPFSIMALSYNSMGIMAMTGCLVLLTVAEKYIYIYILCGMSLACAVLCVPFSFLLWLLYAAAVFCCFLRARKGYLETVSPTLSTKAFWLLTLGAAAVALAFLGFALSRASIFEIIRSIPALFMAPDHTYSSKKLFEFFYAILLLDGKNTLLLYLLLGLVFLFCLFDRRRSERKAFYFWLCFSLTAALMGIHFLKGYINFLMWPMNTVAPIIWLISDNRHIKKIFWNIWVPGILFSFCHYMGSNQRFYAISSAATVALIGSILLLAIYASDVLGSSEKKWKRGAAVTAVIFLFVFQVSAQAFLRYKHIYWDSDVETQVCEIENGPDAGLFVSPAKYGIYQKSMNAVSVLEGYAPEKVLFLSRQTWMYLCGDYEFAGYSAWLSGVNDYTIERLGLYYSLNPHKTPDVVFVEHENQAYADSFCDKFGYIAYPYDECLILVRDSAP